MSSTVAAGSSGAMSVKRIRFRRSSRRRKAISRRQMGQLPSKKTSMSKSGITAGLRSIHKNGQNVHILSAGRKGGKGLKARKMAATRADLNRKSGAEKDTVA